MEEAFWYIDSWLMKIMYNSAGTYSSSAHDIETRRSFFNSDILSLVMSAIDFLT